MRYSSVDLFFVCPEISGKKIITEILLGASIESTPVDHRFASGFSAGTHLLSLFLTFALFSPPGISSFRFECMRSVCSPIFDLGVSFSF